MEVTELCPKCGASRGHFYYNTLTGKAFCHKCGLKSDGWEKTNKLLKIKPVRTPRKKSEKYAIDIEQDTVSVSDKTAICGMTYLKLRGISEDTAKKYNIRFGNKEGVLQNRVIIPLTPDFKYYVARSIYDTDKMKYYSPAGTPKAELLFNIENIKGEYITLMEGVFDVLCSGQHDYAVAILGVYLSDHQLQLLKKFTGIMVWLDNDEVVKTKMHNINIAKHLKLRYPDKEIRVVFQWWGKDPGECPNREETVNNAVLYDFKFDIWYRLFGYKIPNELVGSTYRDTIMERMI